MTMEKVRLPSDNLTPAQLRKKSGPVESYSLGGPMKWDKLLALPYDLRVQYLTKLRDEYKATQIMLAGMLGVSVSTFRRRCKQWDVDFPKTGGSLDKRGIKRWQAFLAAPPIDLTDVATSEEPAPAPTPQKAPGLVPHSGAMTFQGSAGAALRKAYDLLGETECSTLTITWEQTEESP